MHNADQLAEMEKSMREEHRKDLEALERLKRFLPASSISAQKPEPGATPGSNQQLELEEGLAPTSIIGKVESVMIADTDREWTVPQMLSQLRKDKFPMLAKAPLSTLGLTFTKLTRRGKIKLVRRGYGRNPNVYRGIVPQSLSGDSDMGRKSERATQGQPDHVQ